MRHDELIRIVLESDPAADWLSVVTGTRQVFTCKRDLNVRLEFDHVEWVLLDQMDDVVTKRFSDATSIAYEGRVFYGASLICRTRMATVDRGRAVLPLPKLSTMTVERFDFHLARVHARDEPHFHEYVARAGIRVT